MMVDGKPQFAGIYSHTVADNYDAVDSAGWHRSNPGMGWTVKANLSKGYRNPSFKELYLYKMANPDLLPEKMMNYEVCICF